MHIGHVISGAGHLALVAFALLGGVFTSEPPPVEVREVSVISSQEFEAILAAQQPPGQVSEVAQPPQPEAPPAPATAPVPETRVAPPPAPERVAVPQPEPVPDPLPTPPEPDVAVLAPQPAPPQAVEPPPAPDTRPVPRPAERVAPTPVAPPPPEAAPDEIQRDAVREADSGEAREEPQEATAPEEAATEIVTEAEERQAPTASARPPARRPSPPRVADAPDTPTDTPTDSDAVNAALAEALGGTEAPAPSPTGPPLTSGERDALRVAVQSCWNLGTAGTEVLNTTVIVAVEMTRDARPVQGSIRLVSSSGGSASAAAQAFDAARRAILRCGRNGFALPQDKYDRWQQIEMTFNPERMRSR
ncbi:MAG: energy transducer TonB [Pseudomonadota bacterium]